MEQIFNYINPELLVLVPVLYFIGMGAKHSQFVPDNRIPALLGLCGVLLAVLYVVGTCAFDGWQSAVMAVFVALVQGVLCAGCSVYVDQLIKQGQKKEG